MTHGFDVEIASLIGLDEAIMLNSIDFWIRKNRANGRHENEGKFWMYNSAEAFTELFPYWTAKQIRRILDSLIKKAIVIKGQFGGSDRTLWFAISDTCKSILPNGQMDFHITKREDGSAQTGKCSTVAKPVTDLEDGKAKASAVALQAAENIYELYPRKVGKPLAIQSILKALKQVDPMVLNKAVKAFADARAGTDLEFCPHPATWFNQERYNDDAATYARRSETAPTNYVRGARPPVPSQAAWDRNRFQKQIGLKKRIEAPT